jgi:transcriptional regulator with XRE-family HTH domain
MSPDKPVRDDGAAAGGTVGGRVRRFREDRGLSLSQLAEKARVSKGYLSALEDDPSARRPSAETLYAIAAALGVTIADLLGRRLLAESATEIPENLLEFAAPAGLPEAGVRMHASIQFRSEQPRAKEGRRYICTAIRTSEPLDEPLRPER